MTIEPKVSFCDAGLADGDALADLRVEAMRESLEQIGRFDAVRARDRFLSGFSPANTHHIFLGDERIGFYVLKQENQTLLLDHLYVLPAHQGKGIGAIVLARVFSHAEAVGLPVRVGALVGSDSNRFYVRHGFCLVEQGEFDNYYVRPSKNAF